MYFEISQEVFDKLPNFVCGVVAVRGIDNTKDVPGIKKMLEESVDECKAYFDASGNKAKNDPCVEPYRDAFREIGINPNRYACAIEALMDRIAKGKGMPSINPAVDLGNAISLKHKIPIGAHDMNTFHEGISVRPATSDDHFRPFGAPEGEYDDPEEGEIVYVSGNEVRTRRWTWRQSEVGKMTDETTAVFYPIDGFTGFNDGEVKAVMEEFKTLLTEYFGDSDGFSVETAVVDKENPRTDI